MLREAPEDPDTVEISQKSSQPPTSSNPPPSIDSQRLPPTVVSELAATSETNAETQPAEPSQPNQPEGAVGQTLLLDDDDDGRTVLEDVLARWPVQMPPEGHPDESQDKVNDQGTAMDISQADAAARDDLSVCDKSGQQADEHDNPQPDVSTVSPDEMSHESTVAGDTSVRQAGAKPEETAVAGESPPNDDSAEPKATNITEQDLNSNVDKDGKPGGNGEANVQTTESLPPGETISGVLSLDDPAGKLPSVPSGAKAEEPSANVVKSSCPDSNASPDGSVAVLPDQTSAGSTEQLENAPQTEAKEMSSDEADTACAVSSSQSEREPSQEVSGPLDLSNTASPGSVESASPDQSKSIPSNQTSAAESDRANDATQSEAGEASPREVTVALDQGEHASSESAAAEPLEQVQDTSSKEIDTSGVSAAPLVKADASPDEAGSGPSSSLKSEVGPSPEQDSVPLDEVEPTTSKPDCDITPDKVIASDLPSDPVDVTSKNQANESPNQVDESLDDAVATAAVDQDGASSPKQFGEESPNSVESSLVQSDAVPVDQTTSEEAVIMSDGAKTTTPEQASNALKDQPGEAALDQDGALHDPVDSVSTNKAEDKSCGDVALPSTPSCLLPSASAPSIAIVEAAEGENVTPKVSNEV